MGLQVKFYHVNICTYCWNDDFDIHCPNCRPQVSAKYSQQTRIPMDILPITYTNLTPLDIPVIKKNYYLEVEKQRFEKDVSDAELEYFLYWAAHTGVYPIRTSDIGWVKDNEPLTGHAFRGFVTGVKFNKRLVK